MVMTFTNEDYDFSNIISNNLISIMVKVPSLVSVVRIHIKIYNSCGWIYISKTYYPKYYFSLILRKLNHRNI